MASIDSYAYPADAPRWDLPGAFETTFQWEYQDGRDQLLKLYDKGKRQQWDANIRIDWSQDLDPENPKEMPDDPSSGIACAHQDEPCRSAR